MSKKTLLFAALLTLLSGTFTATGALAQTATDLKCKGCVGQKNIGKKAVSTKKIRDDAIKTKKIRNGAVTADKLAGGAKPAGPPPTSTSRRST